MELVRCDYCKTEINPSFPHKKVTSEGKYMSLEAYDEDRHFCSTKCVGKYYTLGPERTNT